MQCLYGPHANSLLRAANNNSWTDTSPTKWPFCLDKTRIWSDHIVLSPAKMTDVNQLPRCTDLRSCMLNDSRSSWSTNNLFKPFQAQTKQLNFEALLVVICSWNLLSWEYLFWRYFFKLKQHRGVKILKSALYVDYFTSTVI